MSSAEVAWGVSLSAPWPGVFSGNPEAQFGLQGSSGITATQHTQCTTPPLHAGPHMAGSGGLPFLEPSPTHGDHRHLNPREWTRSRKMETSQTAQQLLTGGAAALPLLHQTPEGPLGAWGGPSWEQAPGGQR